MTKSGEEPFFAFESEAWQKCIDHTITLTQVYRQKDARACFVYILSPFSHQPRAPEFVELLNELRKGTISPSAQQTFTTLSRPLPPLPSGILPTELYPLRAQVERANTTRLAALPGAVHAYSARDTGTHQRVLEQMVVPSRLAFKVDAQVMLVKNVDEKLVNGTVGRVLGFHTIAACHASTGLSSSQEEDVKPLSRSASSKPKSGSTSTASSQESTASSSATKANGAVRNVQVGPDGRTPVSLCGRTLADKENLASPVKMERDVKPGVGTPLSKGQAKDEELYPLVEFRTQQGTQIVLVVRDEFRVEDNEGKLLARRVQVRGSSYRALCK